MRIESETLLNNAIKNTQAHFGYLASRRVEFADERLYNLAEYLGARKHFTQWPDPNMLHSWCVERIQELAHKEKQLDKLQKAMASINVDGGTP